VKALVSGITGFAGSHLAEYLLSCGDSVVGVSCSGQWPSDVPRSVSDQIPVLRWDLARPLPATVMDVLTGFAPEAIYHLGAISVPGDCGDSQPSARALAVNVGGTRRMLRLAARLSGHPRLLLASSCYVYAPVDGERPRVSEQAPLDPAQAYGRTKLAAEREVLAAVKRGLVDAVVARAFQHTGPRQSPRMIVPDWARQFATGCDPIRVVCLNTFLDLSDVRDVVRAYRALVLDGESGGVYNVGSGCCRRSGDLFDALRQQCDPNRDMVECAPGRRQHPIADISLIRRDTGWLPEVPLADTLADTLRYWQQKMEVA
jgi:GDP-4-dehydro-6-deoxy-D-mannose reductase